MKDMRQELSLARRTFSYIIHAPVISHIGTLIEVTLLRPYALLFGSILATIAVLATSFIAHLHGYTPSGVEPLIGFTVGWSCGLIYELFRYIFRK